ncbi:DUF4962 domain-containing protein, partial [bacterium]|nr:DUF4962 domain-containing protein [bacterium]
MHRFCWLLVWLAPVLALAAPDRAELVKQLDRQARVDEMPCTPAHDARVSSTPPGFVWLPVSPRPKQYVLEVSRSGDFPADNTLSFKPRVSAFVASELLDRGKWHWRVGVPLGKDEVAWGKTRAFTIDVLPEEWPFPDMAALAAKVPRSHPRLFFPADELERVRRECKQSLAKEYRDLLRNARRCIGDKLIPEPAFRKIKSGPERGKEFVGIFRATRPPMDKMESTALAYVLSGDKALGLEAKRRILHFFAWDPNGSTSLFHNDEPAMWVMQRGIRAYDWAYDLFTPDERKTVEACMRERCRQFLKRLTRRPFESRPYSSHPARDLGFLGEAALCFIHEWPEATAWLEYVLTIYRTVYPAWGKDDGGWQEGPGYWGAYMGFALHFAAALKQATGEDITRTPFFRNTGYYKLYCNPPFARMSPFGDGQHNGPSRGSGYLMYAISSLRKDPHLRWYADAIGAGPGSGPLAFSLADPNLKVISPADLPQARVFPGVGLVAMHTNLADPKNDVYLLLRSSPYGSISHGHADQNAFCIEAYGEALAIASGYYPWYSSPHHHNWTRETKAKNCITIDGGQGQVKRSWAAKGRIVHFTTGETFDYAMADASPAYGGCLTKCLRHIVHVRPGVFVILDELAAAKPVTFEWGLHALE